MNVEIRIAMHPHRTRHHSRSRPRRRFSRLGPASGAVARLERLGPQPPGWRVEAVMSGPEEAVAAMLKACAQGPRGSIDHEDIEHITDDGRVIVSDGFEILATV